MILGPANKSAPASAIFATSMRSISTYLHFFRSVFVYFCILALALLQFLKIINKYTSLVTKKINDCFCDKFSTFIHLQIGK